MAEMQTSSAFGRTYNSLLAESLATTELLAPVFDDAQVNQTYGDSNTAQQLLQVSPRSWDQFAWSSALVPFASSTLALALAAGLTAALPTSQLAQERQATQPQGHLEALQPQGG